MVKPVPTEFTVSLRAKRHRIEAQLPISQVASCRTIVCRLNVKKLDTGMHNSCILSYDIVVNLLLILMFVKYQVFLSLGPVEELEVLQPTCTASRLLSSTKSKDMEERIRIPKCTH